MEQLRGLLESKATRVIVGRDYNQIRHELASKPNPPVIYEGQLPPTAPWEHLRDTFCPALARFLQSKQIDPELPRGVMVALFWGDRCYLVEAMRLVEIFCIVEDLNRSAFHFRVLRWLSVGD